MVLWCRYPQAERSGRGEEHQMRVWLLVSLAVPLLVPSFTLAQGGPPPLPPSTPPIAEQQGENQGHPVNVAPPQGAVSRRGQRLQAAGLGVPDYHQPKPPDSV